MITVAERKAFRLYNDGTKENSIDLIEAYGLSTDTKPVENVANGSQFVEMDTGKLYFFDEENSHWYEFTGGGSE